MAWIDALIVVAWLVSISAVGIYAGLRQTTEGFWVNSRHAKTPALIFTIVATQVGAGTIIGITSSTFSAGTGFGLVAIISTVVGFLAVGYVAPWLKNFGDKYTAITLSELLRVRYGKRAQLASAIIIIFAYLCLLAGQFVASSSLVSVWTGMDMKIALIFAGTGLVVYTAFAGLRGDILTDTLHFMTMTLFLFFVFVPAVIVKEPILSLVSQVPASIWSPITFGGYTYLIAGIALGGAIPLLSMELWMRIYASTHAAQARKVFYWSAAIVIPFYLVGLFFGLVAYKLYPSTMPGDLIFFKMITDFLPSGFIGMGIATVLAVVLSASNTLILVISATVFRDILGLDPRYGSLTKSRLITGLTGAVGAGLAYIAPDIVYLILSAFFVIAVIGPSLLGAVFWNRATELGAASSMLVGVLTTTAFLFISPRQAFVPGLIVTIIVFVTVSLVTSHSHREVRDRQLLFGQND